MIQELDKGTIPEAERPAKLNELSKLCGNNKLIPDSMGLRGFRDNTAEVKEYKGPYSVYQNEFKGRKVAVKVLRLYVPQRVDDHVRVSVVSRTSHFLVYVNRMRCRDSAEKPWRGNTSNIRTSSPFSVQRSATTNYA